MEWYLGPEGDQRVWYEADEIERIAESELQRAGLMPSARQPVTDLERFIEGHLRVDLDQYAELPTDVLGLTEFRANRRPRVLINSTLTEETEDESPSSGIVGRWRATMAHEAMHVLLHRYLFDPEMAQLSGGPPSSTQVKKEGLMRCLHRDVTPVTMQNLAPIRRRPDWREVQANRGMATLLMPGRAFQRIAHEQMMTIGSGTVPAGCSSADTLAAAMAEIFNVSKQAAAIRLETLRVV
jgi:hypothetical protein